MMKLQPIFVAHALSVPRRHSCRRLVACTWAQGLLLLPNCLASRPPIRFELNLGQGPSEARFLLHNGRNPVTLDTAGITIHANGSTRRLRWLGANPHAPIHGSDPLPGTSNYILGNDPAHWKTGVPTYARVRYDEIYPGIALVFYGNRQGELEFDFIVAPGAHPDAILLELSGGSAIEAGGDLLWGPVRLCRPFLYQGKRRVTGRFVFARGKAGFQVGAYDKTRPLVIDPVLAMSTYLGGAGGSSGESVAVDAEGNIYVAGTTTSNSFPTMNPVQEFFYGSNDVFVAKFDSTGSNLLYSTYLGSWGDDRALGIAVDSFGSAYVTGHTTSPNFPLKNALQSNYAGGSPANGGDAFVLKLDPSGGNLVYATYIGGGGDDFGRSIAVDSDGNAYVAGSTTSVDFPLAGPLQDFLGGTRDAFVLKLKPDGSALIFSTYFGGSGVEEGNGIALDAAANAYITGSTTSTNLRLEGALQQRNGGGARDSYIAKISADGSALIYSTYIGGTGDDTARGIAVDSEGSAYITGYTTSGTYPTRRPLQARFGGGRDLFISKVAPDGAALVYSTFLGGASTDEGFAIKVGAGGQVYVTGFSQSLDFPVLNGLQPGFGGACTRVPCTADVVVASIDADGAALVYSTYLGGTGADQPRALAIDPAGNVAITGNTASTNFPTVLPLQPENQGGGAAVAFVSRISEPQ